MFVVYVFYVCCVCFMYVACEGVGIPGSGIIEVVSHHGDAGNRTLVL